MHEETFTTKKECSNIKIALLSDIHYYDKYKLKVFQKLINQTKNAKPDYITITGDLLDSSDQIEMQPLMDFFKELSTIAPLIIITGNHDEKKGKRGNWEFEKNNKLIKEINKLDNTHLLYDSIYTDSKNNITFYGLPLSYEHYDNDEPYDSFVEEINNLKTKLDTKTYNVLLIHSPINIYNFIKNNPEHNLNNADLILSGHMHNGCIPHIICHTINKLFKSTRSLISPSKGLFPKYAQGRVYNGPKDGYIYEGVIKLSHATGILENFDFIYQKNIEIINIKKEV